MIFVFPCSEEAMRKAGTTHTKSSTDMENHVYVKAKTRVSVVRFIFLLDKASSKASNKIQHNTFYDVKSFSKFLIVF